ncbi:MAG: acyltransferase domain-containing protein [Proteobacteria bacterium]|nr:MAG: acyltransferase domain-containing protein [Pseudomonadota bacterium]
MSRLEPVLIIAAQTESELLAALSRGKNSIDKEGGFRLAILNPNPERIAKAEKIIGKGKPCQGLQDIWYSPAGLLLSGGKLAFMYPGIDSLGRPEVQGVAEHFQLPVVATPGGDALESRGVEVFYSSDLYTRILEALEIHPSLMFGHSLGEWSGIFASGMIGSSSVDAMVQTLQPGMLPVPGVVFAALGCSVTQAREAIEGLSRIEVSHDNCPHQSIICGEEDSIDQAIAILTAKRVMCQKLDFRSGFHTSMFADFVGPLAQNIFSMEMSTPKVPLWSATTCRPYPEGSKAIQELMIQHLLESVRFRELTEILHGEGVRVFVQVGGGSLPGFINDTLRGKPHLCLSTATPNRESLDQLQRFGLALFVEGAEFRIDLLADISPGDFKGAEAEALATVIPARRLFR